MFRRSAVLALAASTAFACPSFAQEGESIETVGREFLGIMKERGFADARYQSISGNEETFAIRGFQGRRKDSTGETSFSIDSLTVEGLQPDDRWTRAEAVRADGVKLSSGGSTYDFATIYANKAGILDIDGSRPSATFGTMILKGVAATRDGETVFRVDEGYAAADRWVGQYGVPGRLEVTAKGEVSGAALPFLPTSLAAAFGSDAVPVELRLKSSLADVRDELTVSADVATQGRGAWKAEATVVNFDKGLFQAWFDLENPDEKRSAERQKKFDDAYAKERADIGLKSLSVTLSGLGWIPSDVRAEIASSPYVQAASILVGKSAAAGLQQAVSAFAAGAQAFGAEGYARVPVRLGDAVEVGPDSLAPLLFRFSAK